MKGYKIMIATLAIIITSLIVLNVYLRKTLQIEVAEQFNRQQLLLASAETSNIHAYINRVKDEMVLIAQLISKFRINNGDYLGFLAGGVLKNTDKIRTGIRFLDNEGKIIFTYGDPAAEKPFYRDREVIETAKRFCPGESFILQNMEEIHIAAPVCGPGSRIGAVVASMSIHDIAKEFLGPIKSGSRGYAWMMDGKGGLLYHPAQPDMIGRNLYITDTSCFKCHKNFDLEKKIIEGRSNDYGRYVAPSGEDKVLAFSTASVGDSKWIVAVSAPYSEVTMQIRNSMKLDSLLIIFIFLTTSAASVTLAVFYKKKLRVEEIERHEKELEQYAENLEKKVAERTEELSAERDKLKERTEELSNEKGKLNAIVTTVGSGIILVDTEMKIQWVNQRMKEIAGKDLTGMSCAEIFVENALIGSYDVNDLHTDIFSNLFGGQDKYYQVIMAPLRSAENETHGYIKLCTDVTEIKRMEDQMMQAEKLAYLGRLTSGIASEIGNPLTSVFSFVEVLKKMEQDEFKKESLETIYSYMTKIGHILEQMSGFFNMPPLEIKPLKINSLIEASLFLVQYDKKVKDIIIMRDLSPDMPEITTNGNQLSQVIVNIILHAADVMPDGGTLTISSRTRDNGIAIYFEYTGIDISSGDLDNLLGTCSPAMQRKPSLGIAMSYDIIKKLHGSLTSECRPGKAPSLVITLPTNSII